MIDLLLHTGAEHPDLLWVVVPSLLTFAAGIGIGRYAKARRDVPEPNIGVTNE